MENKKRRRMLWLAAGLILVLLALPILLAWAIAKPPEGGPSSTERQPTYPAETVEGSPLSFETIDQEAWSTTGKNYQSYTPGMIVIADTEAISKLDGVVTNGILRQLQNLDFSQSIALAVFRGQRGSMGYDIQIRQITRSGNSVNVYVRLISPLPDTNVGAMDTSPYQLVKLRKNGGWDQEITYNMYSGDQLILSVDRKAELQFLSFETVEQKDYSGSGVIYDSKQPGIRIVSGVEDIDQLKGLVTESSIQQLHSLDYAQYFALAVFQGHKGTAGYEVQIDEIRRLGSSVDVSAWLVEPAPNTPQNLTETSPYQLVKVQKSGQWNNTFTFHLWRLPACDAVEASVTQVVP